MTEIELMEKYEKKLNDLYARANTKSKKKKLALDLFIFSKICYDHFGIDKIYDWDYDIEMWDLLEDFNTPFIENVLGNRNVYANIANGVIDIFKNMDYPLYKDYRKLCGTLTDKEFQDVIFDFLNKYDPTLLKAFKEKLENYEVFEGTIESYRGVNYQLESLNKSFIFFESEGKNTISNASVLLHEFGHSYEFDIFQKTSQSKRCQKGKCTPYSEVSSEFFEYAFIKYLKENRIYYNDSSMCLRDYYIDLLRYMYEISVLSKTKCITLDDDGVAKIDNEEVKEYANKLREDLNFYYDDPETGEDINYMNAYIYGIGNLFSIYLYENYKQDPSNFKKEFRNSLLLYPVSGIEAFERVGITPETLYEGKILRKVLEDSK